jgi:hypothetical protein
VSHLALSVKVEDYSGELIASCLHGSLNALCRLAHRLEMPMLGYVDEYDDTTFNRRQMILVRAELESLRGAASTREQDAVAELVSLIDLVELKPHRYLVFSGD